jgi:hypothetical protein
MSFAELGGRGLGIRKFNEKKELQSKLRDAKNTKRYKDKQKGSDKKANQKQYDTTARRIKKAGKKAGFDLTANKGISANAFDLKVPKFNF